MLQDTQIQELVDVGDKLSEFLELYEYDPVIMAYTSQKGWENSFDARDKWDELVGQLQKENVVGPFIGPDDVVEVEE